VRGSLERGVRHADQGGYAEGRHVAGVIPKTSSREDNHESSVACGRAHRRQSRDPRFRARTGEAAGVAERASPVEPAGAL
jgi:hypothetical protein